ncbi:hypothetical protein BKA67DRAFT_537566 [Truncatella angustata]|uniref:Uncharacterized protein n=1 Tax=Truncatella angustata TaxID=152316 RepID=A0A9P8ZV68_9PEZI|nr:uncharacterized protein BKA67DRAFT_537566 [Truncatella angustata]KAH6651706.1 hypothetical protein BKA67DRAFT_537566 [Truncatella angustata]
MKATEAFSESEVIHDLERGKHSNYAPPPNDQDYDSDSIPSVSDLQRTIRSTLGWWKEEYIYCAICLVAATGLVALLYEFDGELEPRFGAGNGLGLSTVIIAVMTVYRIALSSIVETALSQGAWIWVSAARQEHSHLACVGAGIIILITGFETFSQQMVTFDELPIAQVNMTNPPAPPSPRNLDLGLSTKASFYDGIMASSILESPAFCGTANCTWPTFPTLAVCGNCTEATYRDDLCPPEKGCTYTMPTGTSITAPSGDSTGYIFTVVSSENVSSSGSWAYFSKFDIMSVSKSRASTSVEAYQCALWFCLRSYEVSVTNGQQNTSSTGNWSEVEFSAATSAHNDEYHFIDIPAEMNAVPSTRYSVPLESIEVLEGFMASKMTGNSSNIDNRADYSSDWVQAMQNSSADLPTWMIRLTLSITNDVRSSGSADPNNRGSQYEYAGTAYIQAPHLQVNWLWVIYPLSLMILAFLYLVQTVWRTARDHVSAWKGDSLPMLFAHIDKGIHQVVADGMDVPGGLTDRVGRTQVELVRRQNGQWLFKLPERCPVPIFSYKILTVINKQISPALCCTGVLVTVYV